MIRFRRALRDLALAGVILFLVALIAARLDASSGPPVQGRPRVVDGDTLVLNGARTRLLGIDAPELR